MAILVSVLAFLLLSVLIHNVHGGYSNNKYHDGDHVPLYANKVGPFRNPSETYRYFDLPFCQPDHLTEKREDLGEILNGDRMVDAPYKLDFKVNKESEILCKKKLTIEDLRKFREAITNDYYFQMYYDDLPTWGFIGEFHYEMKSDGKGPGYLIYTHVSFDIFYNRDRVIEINVRTDPRFTVDITEDKGIEVEYMYSVKWQESDLPFEKRMEKYSKYSFLPQHLESHRFSINSCVAVLLVIGFLATILMRVLKNDFVKYSHYEATADDQEETGWKNIHGDVFRYPHTNLCSVLCWGQAHSWLLLLSSSLCWHCLVFSTRTIGVPSTQPFLLYMLLHLALQDIRQPLSIINLKEQIGYGICF